jgi:hypothetical protein
VLAANDPFLLPHSCQSSQAGEAGPGSRVRQQAANSGTSRSRITFRLADVPGTASWAKDRILCRASTTLLMLLRDQPSDLSPCTRALFHLYDCIGTVAVKGLGRDAVSAGPDAERDRKIAVNVYLRRGSPCASERTHRRKATRSGSSARDFAHTM